MERRDHVLITDLSPEAFMASIFLSRLASANGPFFTERDIGSNLLDYLIALPSLLLTISLLEALFLFLVLSPSAGLPQGVLGPGRPIPVFPSEDMVGHKLGEFVATRTYRGHGKDEKKSKVR